MKTPYALIDLNELVRRVLSDVLNLDVSVIKPESSLINDLNADSLELRKLMTVTGGYYVK
ncbi:hypothetical protein [Serratia sp. UGAL515B_01]|uniref:hypothetical protein n=1 Tax=Serratia sp. UGAL515B_01 TaxID=2986763 RepID=UPI0029550BBA|nr:hypothetical protein [Serratia sp. UGAL515B_01]WON77711.1 hypothetical protein OK023_03155 [Serratia sp. UGAL515B_01]